MLRSCPGSSEPPPRHHSDAPAQEEELWLSVHRWLSCKLLLFIVKHVRSVCLSICSPALPSSWLPGIPHTAAPRLLQTRCPFSSHSHCPSLPLLLVTDVVVFHSFSLGLSISSIRLGPLVGRNHVDRAVVISIPVFPAWPHPVHIAIGGMNRGQVWTPLELVSSTGHTGSTI